MRDSRGSPMLRFVYLPTRLPSLVGPHPPSDRRTSMPPPVGGAVPASTVICVAITSVTCAAVRSGKIHTTTTAHSW